MGDEFGPDFITVTDEDGNDIELEFVDALEYNGLQYMAFFPADTVGDSGAEGEEQEAELVILKVVSENGEEFLSTPDTDQELNEVYDRFMEQLFADEEEE